MIFRRRRIIFYFERPQTLSEIKLVTGRSVELIAAGDLATIEAALRLYQQIDVIAAEKSKEQDAALTTLKLAELTHPQTPRVLLVENAAMSGVYEAVHARTVNSLMFMPVRLEQLREAFGIDCPAAIPAPSAETTARRIVGHPPLTGGIKASSSPSFSR